MNAVFGIFRTGAPWRNLPLVMEVGRIPIVDFAVEAEELGTQATYLVADRAYDVHRIVHKIAKQGMKSVIPGKKNRKEKRFFDKMLNLSLLFCKFDALQ